MDTNQETHTFETFQNINIFKTKNNYMWNVSYFLLFLSKNKKLICNVYFSEHVSIRAQIVPNIVNNM